MPYITRHSPSVPPFLSQLTAILFVVTVPIVKVGLTAVLASKVVPVIIVDFYESLLET